MYFTKDDEKADIVSHVDEYLDSYARDVSLSELKEVRQIPYPACPFPFLVFRKKYVA